MEQKYQFKADLLTIHKKNVRDHALASTANEVVLQNGLALVVPNDAGDVTMTAVRDFIDYLFTSMNVSAMPASQPTDHCIRISLNKDIDDAAGYMGYRITVADDGITLEGYDERGIAQGLYYLEDVMNLRKAPFLKKGITRKKALFRFRCTQSPLGMFEYSDAALAWMAHYGMDTIEVWIKDGYTTNRGDFIDLRLLSERAEKYGIDLCLQLYAVHSKHPTDPGAQEFYDALYGDLLTACPKAKYISLSGEATHFKTHDPHANPVPYAENYRENIPSGKPTGGFWPCSDYPEWVKMIQRSIKKYSDHTEIVFSTYNWGWAPEEDRVALIEAMPEGVWIQPTWNMFHQFCVGDTVQDMVDYSLCFEGPGEYFVSEAAAVARSKGLKLSTNAQCSGRTWDFGVAPYEPMPGRWIKQYEGMIAAHDQWNLSGVLENIHYGFYPSFIMDIEKHAFFSNAKPLSELLDEILVRDYGKDAAAVKQACDFFDEAITHYVPTNEDQYGAFRIGPSYPFWLEDNFKLPEGGRQPNQVRTMFGNGIYNPIYTTEIAGRNSVAGVRIREEIKQNRLMADLLLKGIGILETCEQPNHNLQKLCNLARFIYRTTVTVINVKRHYILKQQFNIAETREEAAAILDKVEALLLEEKENVLATFPLVEFDSRIGWEPSMEYTTDAQGLNWKLKQLDYELNTLLPTYRQSNDLIGNF